MRVLLDECVDRRFARLISGFNVTTVPQRGWAGVKNGQLLALAEGEFDVFVTIDAKLSSQQRLEGRHLAVVIMRPRSSALRDLKAFATPLSTLLGSLPSGAVVVLHRNDLDQVS